VRYKGNAVALDVVIRRDEDTGIVYLTDTDGIIYDHDEVERLMYDLQNGYEQLTSEQITICNQQIQALKTEIKP